MNWLVLFDVDGTLLLTHDEVYVEANHLARAEAMFERHLPLIQFEAQPRIGLAIRKELLRRRGALASGRTRVGEPLDPRTAEALDEVLARVGIRPSPEPLQVE